jgi:hypothetical protein
MLFVLTALILIFSAQVYLVNAQCWQEDYSDTVKFTLALGQECLNQPAPAQAVTLVMKNKNIKNVPAVLFSGLTLLEKV